MRLSVRVSKEDFQRWEALHEKARKSLVFWPVRLNTLCELVARESDAFLTGLVNKRAICLARPVRRAVVIARRAGVSFARPWENLARAVLRDLRAAVKELGDLRPVPGPVAVSSPKPPPPPKRPKAPPAPVKKLATWEEIRAAKLARLQGEVADA